MASKNARVGKEGFGEDIRISSKYNYSNGAGWCKKRDRRRANRVKGQTAGRIKCDTCQADKKKRYMAKTSRSYKHRDYNVWMEKTWSNPNVSFKQFMEEQNG